MSDTQENKTAVIDYQLTDAEQRVIDWMRRNSNGHDWMGTIRYVSGPNIYQMTDHIKAGQVKK